MRGPYGHFIIPPSVTEVFEAYGDDLMSRSRVAMTGRINTYNATLRTATVVLGEPLVLADGTVVPVPATLQDVPVFTLQGGTASVAGGVHIGLPIASGDECLLVFNDFDLDAWYAQGGQPKPLSARQHNISDAIALVGLNSLQNPLVSALGATEGGIATALSKISIDAADGLISISTGPEPAKSFAVILQTFFGALAGATDPTVASAASSALAALAAVLK